MGRHGDALQPFLLGGSETVHDVRADDRANQSVRWRASDGVILLRRLPSVQSGAVGDRRRLREVSLLLLGRRLNGEVPGLLREAEGGGVRAEGAEVPIGGRVGIEVGGLGEVGDGGGRVCLRDGGGGGALGGVRGGL